MDTFEQPWKQFHHPMVRDLVWSVFSPALISSNTDELDCPDNALDKQQLHYLQQLDKAPAPLLSWMANCKSTRLGLRFEALWQFWLTHVAKHETANSVTWEHLFNLQIHSSQQTLGELDSLSFCNKNKTLIHRELAVKFYLGINSDLLPEKIQPNFPFCWVGPNVRDRLDLKSGQILHKQLNLLRDNSDAKAALPAHWHWKTLTRQAIVRGRLFYPLNSKVDINSLISLPPLHLRGYWLHRSSLEKLGHASWLILNRQQWFAPIEIQQSSENDGRLLNSNKLLTAFDDYFSFNKQPLQLAAMYQERGYWQERERYFVVPDQWPSIT